MTTVSDAGSWARRRRLVPKWPSALPRVQRVPRAQAPDSSTLVISYMLTILAAVAGVVLFNLAVVGQLQHFTAQHSLYQQLRLSLAEGSTPIGQTDAQNHLVKRGTPMALLEIPQLGLREVVVEGTASRQTKVGVGHRADTPLPGQPGPSVLMGRAAAYGGVFGHLDDLKAGETFTVTTGQGRSTYKVIGVRGPGTKLPALSATTGRLSLITARGLPFLPHQTVIVDADLVSQAFPRPPIAFAPGAIDDSEQPLKGDPTRLLSLLCLLELLVLGAVGAVWARKRWSQPAMWIVFGPVLGAIGLACADRACDLLPNLM
jgi:LPXTG-site transpeptidase (sortase) family protein